MTPRTSTTPPMQASTPLDRVVADFLAAHHHRHPVSATFTGIHSRDSELPDWSRDGLDFAIAAMRTQRAELEAILAESRWNGVPDVSVLDAMLADAVLEIEIGEHEGMHFQRGNPALYTGEAVFGVVSLMLRAFAPVVERAEAVSARLKEIPRFLVQGSQTLSGRELPSSWKTRAMEECVAGMELLVTGLAQWSQAEGLNESQQRALADDATPATQAFRDFHRFVRSVPDSDSNTMACGADFFDLLLRRGHWCDIATQDLLTTAREQLETAETRLAEISAVHGGWPAVQGKLAAAHPSPETYIEAYEQIWEACRATAVDQALLTWPDYPIRYGPIPEWAQGVAPSLYFLHYRSPAPFDADATVDYLVPPFDETRRLTNHSVIKLNHVVHHGATGHHVQNYHAYRAPSRIGQVAAVDCASRINMFCGGSMAEGWACYATDLMEEAGFLTELESVAEQHSRVRQLCRAIVDIEVHHGQMSEVAARQFYQGRAGMSATGAATELTRNTMFPGTALMYWLGTKTIHDLRRDLESRDGAGFSKTAFHDRLLSYGSLPVPLISRLMKAGTRT